MGKGLTHVMVSFQNVEMLDEKKLQLFWKKQRLKECLTIMDMVW